MTEITNVTVAASIPPEIAQAILATAAEMPELTKADRNKYAGYNYVSIDDFYREVPQIAAKHGLFWAVKETGFGLSADADGKQFATYSYNFDLIHQSGLMLPAYGSITIVHPMQGAQTAGSALSYAEKIFMRTTFKIVTGEEDADATDNTKVTKIADAKRKAPPKPVSETPAEVIGAVEQGVKSVTDKDTGVPVLTAGTDAKSWALVGDVFMGYIPHCNTTKELRDFWDKNTGVLDKLSVAHTEKYEEVRARFTERKNELAAKPN